MAASSGSDLEEFEDGYDSYSESVPENDFWEDFLERYTFRYDPTYCLKLRKRLADIFPTTANMLQLKPEGSSWLRKVTLSSQPRRLEVSTTKFNFQNDLLTFAVIGAYDFDRWQPRISWKLSTRWSLGTYKIGRKEKVRLGPAIEFRPRWKLDYSAPEIEGEVGGREGVQVDQGHAHLSIPRVNLLLNVDKALQWVKSRHARHRTPQLLDSVEAGPSQAEVKHPLPVQHQTESSCCQEG